MEVVEGERERERETLDLSPSTPIPVLLCPNDRVSDKSAYATSGWGRVGNGIGPGDGIGAVFGIQCPWQNQRDGPSGGKRVVKRLA